jgi:hypothetical protein
MIGLSVGCHRKNERREPKFLDDPRHDWLKGFARLCGRDQWLEKRSERLRLLEVRFPW